MRDYEINFIEVAVVLGEGVIKQFVSGSRQHLCHNVFVDVAEVGVELVCQKFLVDCVFGEVAVPEGHCYKQSGVGGKQLVAGYVARERHAGVWVVCVVCHEYSFAVLEADYHFLLFFVVGFPDNGVWRVARCVAA